MKISIYDITVGDIVFMDDNQEWTIDKLPNKYEAAHPDPPIQVVGNGLRKFTHLSSIKNIIRKITYCPHCSTQLRLIKEQK